MCDFQKCMLVWVNFNHIPAGNYMFKVNNRNTRTRCEIRSKSIIKTPKRRHFTVLFHLFFINIVFHFILLFKMKQEDNHVAESWHSGWDKQQQQYVRFGDANTSHMSLAPPERLWSTITFYQETWHQARLVFMILVLK